MRKLILHRQKSRQKSRGNKFLGCGAQTPSVRLRGHGMGYGKLSRRRPRLGASPHSVELQFHALRACVLIALLLTGLLGATVARAADTVPTPWNGMDIGSPKPAGSAQADNGTFTVTAGGDRLISATDQFHFVFQSVTGDFAFVARVTFPAGAADSTQAGLMVRDALATTSHFVALARRPGQGGIFQYRTPWASLPGSDTATAANFLWVRLTKRGTTVNGYLAADANNAPGVWKKIGGDEPIASGMVYAGLYLTSQAPGTSSQAVFDHVSLATGPQPLLDDGIYTIAPVSAPALVLNATGAGVALAEPAGAVNQRWIFTGKGGGVYDIQPVSDPSLALTVSGGEVKDGTALALQADTGLSSQRWSVVSTGNETYGLAPQCAPGSGLDDLGGNATPAAHIDIWQRWDTDPHTQWIITPAP